MEVKGYREQLAKLEDLFPRRLSITPDEAASVIGCDRRTVYATMYRVKDPLPHVRLSKRCVTIPLTQFAAWLCRSSR